MPPQDIRRCPGCLDPLAPEGIHEAISNVKFAIAPGRPPPLRRGLFLVRCSLPFALLMLLSAASLVRKQFNGKRAAQLKRDILLNAQDVTKFAIVNCRPNMSLVFRLD